MGLPTLQLPALWCESSLTQLSRQAVQQRRERSGGAQEQLKIGAGQRGPYQLQSLASPFKPLPASFASKSSSVSTMRCRGGTCAAMVYGCFGQVSAPRGPQLECLL